MRKAGSVMLEQERINVDSCGCRHDAPTGLVTHYCEGHDPDRSKRVTIKTVPIRTLRRGSIFRLSDGKRYRLLYANDCRALIEPARREVIRVRRINKRTGALESCEFEARAGSWNIAPTTMVEVERRS